MILPFMSFRRSVTVSAAFAATATVDSPSDRLSEIALNPFTSDSITLEMAQTAELSRALATRLPVEIWLWVSVIALLTDLSV